MPYTIALVPLKPVPGLEEISSLLARRGSPFTIGKNSLPHVTLVQLYEGNPTTLWNALAPFHGVEIAVKLTTAYAHTKPSGSVWFGVGVEKTPTLVTLQEEIVSALGLPADAYNNHLGDRYFPHFTTGTLPAVLDAALHGTRVQEGLTVNCKLHFGVAGPNWQFERILF